MEMEAQSRTDSTFYGNLVGHKLVGISAYTRDIATRPAGHGYGASEIRWSDQTLGSRIWPNWHQEKLNGELKHEGPGLLNSLLRMALGEGG